MTEPRIADLHQDMLRLADAQAVAAKYARRQLSQSLGDFVEELTRLTHTLNDTTKEN